MSTDDLGVMSIAVQRTALAHSTLPVNYRILSHHAIQLKQ